MIIDPSLLHRRTYCPRCMKDTEEILVTEAALEKFECPVCGMIYYGGVPGRCEKCGNSTYGIIGRPIAELAKLPQLCGECIQEMKDFYDEVKMGGVYFSCSCGKKGVIFSTNEFAKNFRKRVGKSKPEICGVELDECPECVKRRIT